MNHQAGSKSFFLISFLPAIAYWYLEAYYPVRVAVTGGLIMAVLEIALEYFFTKHVHSISKFNFFLILVLGGLSLLDDKGIWFKLQPFFTGVVMGGYLLYKIHSGVGLFLEMMRATNPEKQLPEEMMKRLERDLAYFMIVYGIFMGFIALYGNQFTKETNEELWKLWTNRWVFFKTVGFYIAFFLFMVVEFILMRKIKPPASPS